MLVSIKPHSSLKKYFIGNDIELELKSYSDVLDYLTVMQPKFIDYTKKLVAEQLQESIAFLDDNLNEITSEDFELKRFKRYTTIYIVPVIYGGGGKRGGILAILAAAALMWVPGVNALALNAAGSIAAAGGATGAGIATAASSMVSNLALSLALNGLSALLMKRPDPNRGDESNRVENNMFGSLTNSVDSGKIVPINYGMVRVAGQLVTGYIKTLNHPKGFNVKVSDVIGYNTSIYDSTLASQSGFLTMPGSISTIVRDGLVMYIDPANLGSFVESITEVTDVASGQTGFVSGNVYIEDFSFKFNGGHIDMSKSYVSANEISTSNNEYTIETWAKIPTSISNSSVIYNDALGFTANTYTETFERSAGPETWTEERVTAQIFSSNTTPLVGGAFKINSWQHIAQVQDDTNLKVYVNGKLLTNSTISSNLETASNLIIGSAGLANSYIGNVKLYNRPLSIEEITKNYKAEKSRFETL